MASDDFPYPGSRVCDRIVMASCYYRELTPGDNLYRTTGDDWPDVVYLVLLLNDESPYFTVACVAYVEGSWVLLTSETQYNIIHAVETYSDWGGDV